MIVSSASSALMHTPFRLDFSLLFKFCLTNEDVNRCGQTVDDEATRTFAVACRTISPLPRSEPAEEKDPAFDPWKLCCTPLAYGRMPLTASYPHLLYGIDADRIYRC